MDPALLALSAVAGLLAGAAVWEIGASAPRLAGWARGAAEPFRRAASEGYSPTPAERRRLAILASLGLLAGVAVLLGPLPAPLAAIAGPGVAGLAVSRRRRAYRQSVEEAVPAIATACADSLAAGRTLRAALGELHRSFEGPAAVELGRIATELELGMPTAEVLRRLRRRISGEPAQTLCVILASGSLGARELVRLLRRHALATADRARAAEEARSATAQARFTGILVAAMPAGTLLVAELLAPGFLGQMLAHPVAAGLLLVAAALQIAGFTAIRRLARVPG